MQQIHSETVYPNRLRHGNAVSCQSAASLSLPNVPPAANAYAIAAAKPAARASRRATQMKIQDMKFLQRQEARRTYPENHEEAKEQAMNTDKQVNLPIPVIHDGFGDSASSDRVIQGSIVRCVDGHWSDRDGIAFPAEIKMLALATAIALQRWKDQVPIETIIKTPGQPLPDLEELNAKIPNAEWEPGLNDEPRPPWVRQHIVYLLNPVDAAFFTFINGTVGAAIAVDRLKNKVVWMRQLRGSNVVPLVKLDSKPMKTKFGQKMRPEFTIVDWRRLGGGGLNAAQIEHRPDDYAGLQPVEMSIEEEMNDSIPRL